MFSLNMLLHSSKSHAHGQQSANRPACADSGQACRQRPHQLHRRNVVRNVRPIAAATIDGEDVPHLFVFGMGYTASAVASYLRHVNSGW